MNPTAGLLWEAARPAVRPDEVAALIASGADIDQASTLALGHGLGPLLVRALGTVGHLAAPAARADADMCRAQSRVVLPRAVALATEPLIGAGHQPVIWKGPAVACRYPDAALRPMTDIDMILPAEEHPDAVAALHAAGWRTVKAKRGGEHYDTGLVHPDLPGLPLELHYALNSWHQRSHRLDSEDLWARRVPVELFGVRTWGLCAADEVVALAAHAGKPYHVFSRLIWVTDLAVVSDGADWRAVRDTAAAAECLTMLAVGLRLATMVGATPPWWAMELPDAGDRRRTIDEVLDRDWPLVVGLPENDERLHELQRRLRFALLDRPSRAVAAIAGDVVSGPPVGRTRRALGAVRRAGRAWLS